MNKYMVNIRFLSRESRWGNIFILAAPLPPPDAAPQWLEHSGDQVLAPGAGVSLGCRAQGSPPPVISWTLQGIPVSPMDPRLIISEQVRPLLTPRGALLIEYFLSLIIKQILFPQYTNLTE